MADEQGQFSREIDIQNSELVSDEFTGEETTREEQDQNQLSDQEAWQLQQEIEANELAAIREEEAMSIQQQAAELLEQAKNFQNPPLMKWGILFTLAIVNDVIDVLALTGIGELLSWVVSIGLTALILIILWMSDTDLKRAHRYVASVGDIVQQNQIATQVRQIETRVQGAAKGLAGKLKKIPGFQGIKVLTTPRKNPLTKVLMGGVIESIPYVGAINLLTVWLFFAYLDERRVYKEAWLKGKEASEQMLTSSTEMV